MIPRSYLILSPANPGDTQQAIATQRQSIPMAWAFSVAAPTTRLHVDGPDFYFESTIGDALGMLDKALSAWNYNRYFRDVLAPFQVFRAWLANNPSETRLYLNVTELVNTSGSAAKDLLELANLGEKVDNAIEEISGKHFTPFLHLLRRVSYPLVTIPITGDRETDEEILRLEMRDMPTPEAELALQLVGVDTTRHMLHDAIASIRLRAAGEEIDLDPETRTPPALILYTTHPEEAERLMVDGLGATLISHGHQRITFGAKDREFIVVTITGASEVE